MEVGPEKKLLTCEKRNKRKRCLHIKHITVPTFVVIMCICLLKNVNQNKETDDAKVINTIQKSQEITSLLKAEMLQQTANILDKKLTMKMYHFSETQFLERLKKLKRSAKTHAKIGKPKKARKLNQHKEDGFQKTKKLKRQKRYVTAKRAAAQKQLEISGKAATLSSTLPNVNTFYAAAIKCQEYPNNCSLYCIDGTVSFLDDDVNYFKPKCPNTDLSLILTKCVFNYGILQQSFFYSTSSLAFLTINECNLQTIKTSAFQHQNVKNLHTLILINNQLTTLQDNTFVGLTSLSHFEFVQNPLSTIFEGKTFLKPLANNLKEAVIQPSVNSSEITDPLNWWRDLKMITMTELDLSNTNLQGVLNSTTFQTFVKLQVLRLCNCKLSSINAEVFTFITADFKYLDLQNNDLQTLDSDFLQRMAITGVSMNLNSNEWFCECRTEMLHYFSANNVSLIQDIICSSPDKWLNMELNQVLKECRRDVTSTKTYTISSSANPPTSNAAKASSTDYCMTNSTAAHSSTPMQTTTTVELTVQSNTTTGNSMQTTTKDLITVPPTTIGSTTETTTKDRITVPPTTIGSTTETTTKDLITTIGDSTTTITATKKEPDLLPPLSLMPIQCFVNKCKTETVLSQVLKPQLTFTISIASSTSLLIKIDATKILPHFAIIYFTDYENYAYLTNIENTNYIEEVKPYATYMICVFSTLQLAVSPFDCQTYFVHGKERKSSTWLFEKDKTWFIAISSITTMLLFLASILIAYKLLRYNPHWLVKPCQAQHQDSISGIALKSTRNCNSEQHSFSQQSSPVLETSVEYLNSRKHIQEDIKKDEQILLYYSQHAVPLTRAPHAPPTENFYSHADNTSGSSFNRRTECVNSPQAIADYLDIIENDPYYQTIDYYETIK